MRNQPDPEQADVLAPLLAADSRRPFVVAQLGQSLDGRIATAGGESRYINGEGALDHLHLLRAHVDAVVVGAGTVAADDPQLTVRRGLVRRNPARVVIDPRGRLPSGRRWQTPDGARLIRICGAYADAGGPVDTILLPLNEGRFSPRDIVMALFSRGLNKLLIEGGAATVSGFIDAGCVDRLHVMVAPLIIGSGKPGLDLAPVDRLAHARRPPTRVFMLPGGDVLFDCDLSGGQAISGDQT